MGHYLAGIKYFLINNENIFRFIGILKGVLLIVESIDDDRNSLTTLNKEYLVYALLLGMGYPRYIIYDENEHDHVIIAEASRFILKDGQVSSFWVFDSANLSFMDASWRDNPLFLENLADSTCPMENEIFKNTKSRLEKEFTIIHQFMYQNPNINFVAEDIGKGWYLCPHCSAAFEVLMNVGFLECTECGEISNNPSAMIK